MVGTVGTSNWHTVTPIEIRVPQAASAWPAMLHATAATGMCCLRTRALSAPANRRHMPVAAINIVCSMAGHAERWHTCGTVGVVAFEVDRQPESLVLTGYWDVSVKRALVCSSGQFSLTL